MTSRTHPACACGKSIFRLDTPLRGRYPGSRKLPHGRPRSLAKGFQLEHDAPLLPSPPSLGGFHRRHHEPACPRSIGCQPLGKQQRAVRRTCTRSLRQVADQLRSQCWPERLAGSLSLSQCRLQPVPDPGRSSDQPEGR